MNYRNIDAWITRILRWFAYTGAFFLLFLTVLVFVDVMGAKFFKLAVPGAVEISELLMVLLTLLAVGYVAVERGHIRIDILDKYMSKTVLHAVRLFGYALSSLVMGFVGWRSLERALYTLKAGVQAPSSALQLQIWPGVFVTSLGFFLLTIAFILVFIRTIVAGTKQPPSANNV